MSASPFAAGVTLALLAALSFGATLPVLAWAGRGLGPFATASLLYAGAAAAALAVRGRARATGPGLGRADLGRLLAIALAGAALAPALLSWGVQRVGATTGSLLLALEAAFTVALAWLWFREPVGARVLAALVAIAAGAALSIAASTGADDTGGSLAGGLAVAGATLAWAIDNTLTRALAEREPLAVVAAKGALGAAVTALGALVIGEPAPTARAAVVLVACGATGYGLSLRWYLLAQRRIGAARTGSVFALAPFLGAALAVVSGGHLPSAGTGVAALLLVVGVWLHLTEEHGHAHVHEAETHDHAHRHDDGHHDHVHEPAVTGVHSHRHSHARLVHDHDHAPDVHHGHAH